MSTEDRSLDSIVATFKAVDDQDLARLTETASAQALYQDVVMRTMPGTRPRTAAGSRWHAKEGHRLRWALTAGAMTLAIALGATLFPDLDGPDLVGPGSNFMSTARAAIDVQSEGGRYIIRFTRLAEDTAAIERELKALGLDVDIDFVPASPSVVGTLVASSGGDGTEEFLPPSSLADPVPAVTVPLNYQGQLDLYIGRAAELGETYETSPALGAEAPGEVLHGSRIYGVKVTEAMAILEARGLAAEWRDDDNEVRPGEELTESYVHSVVPWTPGRVLVFTGQKPPEPRSASIEEALSAD